jgi:hypothetical protein
MSQTACPHRNPHRDPACRRGSRSARPAPRLRVVTAWCIPSPAGLVFGRITCWAVACGELLLSQP